MPPTSKSSKYRPVTAPQALRAYAVPRYPTRPEIEDDPGLLRRKIPLPWRAVPQWACYLSMFLAAGRVRAEGIDGGEATGAASGPGAAASTGPAAIVAPIFRHGPGRGHTGCMSVCPPVFLSEEEAMQVIREELGKAGVRLGTQPVVWDDVQVGPLRKVIRVPLVRDSVEADSGLDRQAGDAPPRWAPPKGRYLPKPKPPAWAIPPNALPPVWEAAPRWTHPLELDGWDAEHRLGIEFVSLRDHDGFRSEDPNTTSVEFEGQPKRNFTRSSMASARTYELLEAAENLRQTVSDKQATPVYFGTFYDPVSSPDCRKTDKASQRLCGKQRDEKALAAWREAQEEIMAEAREKSRRLLRAQVSDFVDWLKAQGAM